MCTPQEEESRKHFEPLTDTRSCLRHPSFRLGSGAVRPSGDAPRPWSPAQSGHEDPLLVDSASIGATICARTQMTKPRILAFGLVILLCLLCSALYESDITIVDESDIEQSQLYSTAQLCSHGDQSPGLAWRSSTGPEGDPIGLLAETRASLARAPAWEKGREPHQPQEMKRRLVDPVPNKKTVLVRLEWLSNILAIFADVEHCLC